MCPGTSQEFLNYFFHLHSHPISFSPQHIAKFLNHIHRESYSNLHSYHLWPHAATISIRHEAILGTSCPHFAHQEAQAWWHQQFGEGLICQTYHLCLRLFPCLSYSLIANRKNFLSQNGQSCSVKLRNMSAEVSTQPSKMDLDIKQTNKNWQHMAWPYWSWVTFALGQLPHGVSPGYAW